MAKRASFGTFAFGTAPFGAPAPSSTVITATLTGVAGTSAPGSVSVIAAASVVLTGAAATGSPGTVSVAAKANVNPTGVAATGSPGSVSVAAKANVNPTGVAATGSPGTVTVSAKATAPVTGVSATGGRGTLTVIGKANIRPIGAGATGRAGEIRERTLEIWPPSLPPAPTIDSYSNVPDPAISRMVMDSGRALQRKDFRQRFYTVTCSWILTNDQLVTFRAFADYKIGFGASFFTIDINLDRGLRHLEARFMADKPPVYSYESFEAWRVTATLEVIDEAPTGYSFTSTWPTDLPLYPGINYQQKPQPGVIRSNLPGFARQRRRFPAAPDIVTPTWLMTGQQLYTFKAFAEQQGRLGASFFTITLPLDNERREVRARFIGDQPPNYSYISVDAWQVSTPLEIINPAPLSPDAQEVIDVIGTADLFAMQDDLVPPPTLQPFFLNYHSHFPAH